MLKHDQMDVLMLLDHSLCSSTNEEPHEEVKLVVVGCVGSVNLPPTFDYGIRQSGNIIEYSNLRIIPSTLPYGISGYPKVLQFGVLIHPCVELTLNGRDKSDRRTLIDLYPLTGS